MLRKWLPGFPDSDIDAAVRIMDGYSGAHVYELARFAKVLQEQDGLAKSEALAGHDEQCQRRTGNLGSCVIVGPLHRPKAEHDDEADDEPDGQRNPKRVTGHVSWLLGQVCRGEQAGRQAAPSPGRLARNADALADRRGAARTAQANEGSGGAGRIVTTWRLNCLLAIEGMPSPLPLESLRNPPRSDRSNAS